MAENKGVAPEDTIILKVLGLDNTIIKFKMKKNTPLMKLMKSYSETIGFAVAKLRFQFDEEFIDKSDTPSFLNMKDGDCIYVYKAQGTPDGTD